MKKVLLFVGGVVLGGAISWQYHKTKYEEMVQEEIESLREHHKKKKDEKNDNEEETTSNNEEESSAINEEEYDKTIDKAKHAKITSTLGYIDTDMVSDEEESYVEDVDIQQYIDEGEPKNHIKSHKPYLISPEEFGNVPLYDCDTFYYHKNDVITNCDDSDVVDNVEFYTGMKTLEIKTHYGEYEQDAVYFRNDQLKTDYEILWDEEDFDEGSY